MRFRVQGPLDAALRRFPRGLRTSRNAAWLPTPGNSGGHRAAMVGTAAAHLRSPRSPPPQSTPGQEDPRDSSTIMARPEVAPAQRRYRPPQSVLVRSPMRFKYTATHISGRSGLVGVHTPQGFESFVGPRLVYLRNSSSLLSGSGVHPEFFDLPLWGAGAGGPRPKSRPTHNVGHIASYRW